MFQEKNSFLFGLSIGVASVSLIGFLIMAVAYIQKGGSNSAANENSDQVAQDQGKNNDKPTPSPAPEPNQPANIKVSDSDHIRGNKNAPITIVEFSDLQCPFCSRFHDTMKQVMAAYPNDVRWVYKHFPLNFHQYAQKSAEASECASEQGKFWEYADNIFANQSSLNNDYLATAAKNVGLNTKKFDECLSSGKYASKVSSDYSQGQQAGVTGTPANFINGQLVAGAVPFETIKQKIESLK
jgi:protein-disulfide isomerase